MSSATLPNNEIGGAGFFSSAFARAARFGVRQLAAAFPKRQKEGSVCLVTLTESGSKLPHSKAAAEGRRKRNGFFFDFAGV